MSSNLHEVNPNFATFCKKVAAAIGVPHLDGMYEANGYSIDLAGTMFDAGCSISEAVAEIRAVQRHLRSLY